MNDVVIIMFLLIILFYLVFMFDKINNLSNAIKEIKKPITITATTDQSSGTITVEMHNGKKFIYDIRTGKTRELN